MTELWKFKGNRLTVEEKEFRLKELDQAISIGWVDEDFIPFLHRINKLPFFMTTQCCTGHGDLKPINSENCGEIILWDVGTKLVCFQAYQ